MDTKKIAIIISDSPEDILSAAPLITALKKANPGHEVGFVVKESGHEISNLVPGLDFIDSYESEATYEKIYDLSGDSSDHVYSESIDWKSYLIALPSLELGNPFHKIDLYKKVAAVDTIDVNYELAPTNTTETDVEEALSVGGNALKIAICVASTPIEVIRESIKAIEQAPFPCAIYFVGTIKDRKHSADLALESNKMVIDLCGRLSANGNANILRSSDLCICGPGTSALISSGYGTFTICYDAIPERGPIAYPYGHGHLIFQPHSQSEIDLSYYSSLLRDCLEHAVLGNGGNIPSLEQWQTFIDSKIGTYLSKIRLLATQRVELVLSPESSFTELQLRPLLFMGTEHYEVLRTFYRLLWEHSLNQRTISTNDLEILHKDSVPVLCELLKPFEQMFELANFGSKYSDYIGSSLKENNLEKAKADSERLQEVEDLLRQLGTSHAALRPLSAFHEKKQALLPDQNPVKLAKEMSQLFNDLKARVLVMLDLEKTLFHTSFANEVSSGNSPGEEANFE